MLFMCLCVIYNVCFVVSVGFDDVWLCLFVCVCLCLCVLFKCACVVYV